MRTAAIVCNLVLFASTGLIVLTEGVPREVRYAVLTLLALLVPLFSAAVLVREQTAPQAPDAAQDASPRVTLTYRAAVLGNSILFGAVAWASVVQYPYPEGNSVMPFVVLAICVPIVSLLALALLVGRRKAPRETMQSTAAAK